jgi:hypothetical protein
MANNGLVGIKEKDFDEIIDKVIVFSSVVSPVQNLGFEFLPGYQVVWVNYFFLKSKQRRFN